MALCAGAAVAAAACSFDWDAFDPRETLADGGGGGSAGAGGSPSGNGTGANGGGGTSGEDCTNGRDDDQNGAVDCDDAACADHTCVVLPAGWSPVQIGGCPTRDMLGIGTCDACICNATGICQVKVTTYNSGNCSGAAQGIETIDPAECVDAGYSGVSVEVTEIPQPACTLMAPTTGVVPMDACAVAAGTCEGASALCLPPEGQCIRGQGTCPPGYTLSQTAVPAGTASCDCSCAIGATGSCSGSSAIVWSTNQCQVGGSMNSLPADPMACYTNQTFLSLTSSVTAPSTQCDASATSMNHESICCPTP